MAVSFDVKFEAPGVAEALERALQRSDNELVEMLTDLGRKGEQVAKSLAPNMSGRFISSIGYEVDRRSVTIGSTSRRAHIVESGRKPGKPPPTALIASIFDVSDRAGAAFTIARAIGRHGTPGTSLFENTRRTLTPAVNDAASDLAARLGRLDDA